MGNNFENLDMEEVENKLCQIKDVRAARIIKGKNNSIEEIHILAVPNKGPKQLVRDIESALMAEYGLPVNHKKVSIARVIDNTAESPKGEKQARLKIISMNTDLSGVYAQVQVLLELNGQEYEGMARGAASQTGRIRLVAQATLNAAEKFVQGTYSFALEDVGIINLGCEKVAVACVILVSSFGSEEVFSGSAGIKQNEKDSIMRATLDAINRRFGFLITA